MVDLVVLLAVALLVLGVVGSVVPLLPGAPLSLAGVYLYWWHTGFTDPGVLVIVGFTLVGGFATVMDYFGGPIGASAGGASLLTSVLAGLVGVVLLFTLGPVAMVVGIPVTVFLLEFRRHDDVETGVRTALYATVGILASAVMQVVLTGVMLVAFLVVVFV